MILYLSIGALFDSVAYLMVMPTLVLVVNRSQKLQTVISFLKENQNGAFPFEKMNRDYFTVYSFAFWSDDFFEFIKTVSSSSSSS